MMFALLRNKKRKLMIGVEFVLFVPTVIARDGGRYNIAVIRESHTERIFTRNCLTVRFWFIEVMVKLPYLILLIHRS